VRQRLLDLVVGLIAVDAEREAARVDPAHRAAGLDEARRGMTGAGAGDAALGRIERHVGHRDELAGRDLPHHDLVCRSEEVGRRGVLPRERAEDELRHGHVRRRVDPVAGHVAEDDRESAALELHEVVDVPAHVDARRRLVDRAELEALQLGVRAREQRALHRVRELLLLLVEASVVERERCLAGDGQREVDGLLRDWAAGTE